MSGKDNHVNCENCGAPMRLFRDQDYFYCEYCGAFHFPPASSDGIRSLGSNQEGIACPHCHVPLQIVTLDDRFQGHQCPHCQGFLFDRNTFRLTIETRRAMATTPPDPPRPLNQDELKRGIACPACTRSMDTHPYLGPGTIVIDTCSHCSLIWLDNGELNRVVNAPGIDRGRGTPPLPQTFTRQSKKQATQRSRYELDLRTLLEKFFQIDD